VEHLIGTWLAAWAGAVLARPRLTALATLALGALAAWYAAGNLGVNTDTANMIAATVPWRQHFNDYRDTFPLRDRNLLIVVDAPSAVRADEVAAALLRELRAQPDRYRSPLLAGEGEFFERNGMLYLPTTELADLTDRLAAAQPLVGLLQARFDGAAVLDVARETLSAEAAGSSRELASFYDELAETIGNAADRQSSPLAWDRVIAGAASSAPRERVRRIIAVQPAVDFTRMQPAAVAIAEVRAIAARLAADGDVAVRLTGTVAMEHEELLSVSRGAGFGALATLVMVALVLYAALRSWRLLAASIVTLVAGLSLTAAFAAVAVGQLNLLSVAFVVLNVGLGSDYVIHVLLRYRELAAAGRAAPAALVETVRGVGSSLVLCAVTTAAGFYAFIPTTFEGVSELGLIAGTGVFFGLFASVTLLPALVAWWDRPRRTERAPTWLDPRIFAPLSRAPRLVLGATTVALVAALAALPRVTFDSNPIHLRDPQSESVSTLLELAADGDAPLLNLVAVAADRSTALAWAERLRSLPEVRSVVTADSLVPEEQGEKLALLDDLALLMGSDFGELERTPAAPAALAAALAALEAETAGDTAARPLHDAAADLNRRLAAGDERYRDATLRRLDDALTAGLPHELAKLAAALRAEAFDRADLPAALAGRWLAGDGRELVEIAPAEDVSDNAAARRFIAAVHAVVPTATGLPVVYDQASATVVAAFERALLYAFVMVAAIIWLVLRDFKDMLLVLVPIALASVLTAALTVAVDMPFNYANIIALPLLVGIGVDNGIHVVHRMRGGDVARLFDTSTMRAVLASGLTTVASFGNLAFSSHVGTSSMGILLALGLAASMAATLIVLPAWLALRTPKRRAAA
jgi:hopanoid biosynthesis associated RND transporter like protein HpnN